MPQTATTVTSFHCQWGCKQIHTDLWQTPLAVIPDCTYPSFLKVNVIAMTLLAVEKNAFTFLLLETVGSATGSDTKYARWNGLECEGLSA